MCIKMDKEIKVRLNLESFILNNFEFSFYFKFIYRIYMFVKLFVLFDFNEGLMWRKKWKKWRKRNLNS